MCELTKTEVDEVSGGALLFIPVLIVTTVGSYVGGYIGGKIYKALNS